jgi:hypothetical protein
MRDRKTCFFSGDQLEEASSKAVLVSAGEDVYFLPRGLKEKSSLLSEGCSNLAVWRTIVDRAIPFIISSFMSFG